MAKDKKIEQKGKNIVKLSREIPTPKNSLKTSSPKPPKKDDENK